MFRNVDAERIACSLIVTVTKVALIVMRTCIWHDVCIPWNVNTCNSTCIEFGAPVIQLLEFGVVTGQSQGCVICQGFVLAAR